MKRGTLFWFAMAVIAWFVFGVTLAIGCHDPNREYVENVMR